MKKGAPGSGWWILAVSLLIIGAAGWIAWRDGHLDRWRRRCQPPITAQTNVPPKPARPALDGTQTNTAISRKPVDQTSAIVRVELSAPRVVTNHVATPLTNRAAPGPGEQSRQSLLEAQIALDRLGISPGSIDGVMGYQTRAALRAFQLREGLPGSGQLDTNTAARLLLTVPALATTLVEEQDLARLTVVPNTWLEKSEQARLDFETVLELLAERSHAHPSLIRRLNPGVDWNRVAAGTTVIVPWCEREKTAGRAAYLQIQLGARLLRAFDGFNRLLAHFPCSIAQRVEKRPQGELRVAVVVPNPDYTFNPEVFPESAEARQIGRKLRLPPGPNNPVGAAWIGLDIPGYGIHGTPKPEDVGRTESHGCFRLANWNAEHLLQLVTVGTPVIVEP